MTNYNVNENLKMLLLAKRVLSRDELQNIQVLLSHMAKDIKLLHTELIMLTQKIKEN